MPLFKIGSPSKAPLKYVVPSEKTAQIQSSAIIACAPIRKEFSELSAVSEPKSEPKSEPEIKVFGEVPPEFLHSTEK